MRKILLVIVFFPLLIAAQDKNKLTVDERSGKPMLIGFCDRTAFADTNFAWWYNSEYDNYEVNTTDLDLIKGKLNGISVKIILGTWCSDSRREVPRFIRILDELKFDESRLTLICVDRKKESPAGNIKELEIKLVPTFILYREGKEIGRIIETPQTTLECDLQKLLN